MKKKEVGTRVRVTREDSEWLDFKGVITSINEKNDIASVKVRVMGSTYNIFQHLDNLECV